MFGTLFLIILVTVFALSYANYMIAWMKAETENELYTEITMYVYYGLIVVGFITAIILLII